MVTRAGELEGGGESHMGGFAQCTMYTCAKMSYVIELCRIH